MLLFDSLNSDSMGFPKQLSKDLKIKIVQCHGLGPWFTNLFFAGAPFRFIGFIFFINIYNKFFHSFIFPCKG